MPIIRNLPQESYTLKNTTESDISYGAFLVSANSETLIISVPTSTISANYFDLSNEFNNGTDIHADLDDGRIVATKNGVDITATEFRVSFLSFDQSAERVVVTKGIIFRVEGEEGTLSANGTVGWVPEKKFSEFELTSGLEVDSNWADITTVDVTGQNRVSFSFIADDAMRIRVINDNSAPISTSFIGRNGSFTFKEQGSNTMTFQIQTATGDNLPHGLEYFYSHKEIFPITFFFHLVVS